MARTDLHKKLCGYYEFMLGKLPNREEFIAALRHTLTENDIRVIFLLPFIGEVSYERFAKKAAKIGISAEELEDVILRLVPEGFIATYVRSQKKDFAGRAYPSDTPLVSVDTEGRVYARGEIISMTEMQVRKPEHDPMRQAAAYWMDYMIEGGTASMPTKTPYYRVIPVEPTLPKEPRRERIHVGEKIEDPRAVLPLDVVSKMVQNEHVMAVADCYCRRTKTILGEGCDCPTETCAQWRAEIGRRMVDGQSEDEILDYFAARYGDHVLQVPPKRGFFLWIWALPVLALLAGLVFLGLQMKKWRDRHEAEQVVVEESGIEDEYLRRVQQD